MEKKCKALLVVLALAFTFALVYSPHFSYRYPLHVDEWQHIAKAVYLTEYRYILDSNPYLNYNATAVYAPNVERGMTVFLAELSLLTGLDPVMSHRFLPALFAMISAFALFVLIYSLTKKFYASLFSIIFFAALKSNINITGLWFFTPLTFSIPFIFLSVWFFISGIEKQDKARIVFSILFAGTVLLIQPLFAAFILVIYSLFLMFNPSLVRKNLGILNPWTLSLSLILPLMVAAYFFNFFWRGSLADTAGYMAQFLIFPEGWGHIELKYFLPSLYGIVPALFAVIGIYPALKKKRTRIFIIWAIASLAILSIFRAYSFSILAPYQRVLYFCMLGMVPLSAMGLEYTMRLIRENFHRLSHMVKHHGAHLSSAIAASAFSIILLLASFHNYYSPPQEDRIYHVIEDKDYGAFMFLKSHANGTTIIPPRMSTAAYPISKNRVIGMTKGNLPGGNISDVISFYEGDCRKKDEILKKYDIWFVLSEEKIECDGLYEMYSNGDYVYSPWLDW